MIAFWYLILPFLHPTIFVLILMNFNEDDCRLSLLPTLIILARTWTCGAQVGLMSTSYSARLGFFPVALQGRAQRSMSCRADRMAGADDIDGNVDLVKTRTTNLAQFCL